MCKDDVGFLVNIMRSVLQDLESERTWKEIASRAEYYSTPSSCLSRENADNSRQNAEKKLRSLLRDLEQFQPV